MRRRWTRRRAWTGDNQARFGSIAPGRHPRPDFTHALAGPYCTMLLGDLGADVVKIEPPAGDHSRQWGPPFIKGESSYFLSINRNKRSVVLDLKKPAALAVAQDLAVASDVVVENFKPGAMARLGLDAK